MVDREPIECGKEGCVTVFVPQHHLRKFCDEHVTRPTNERYLKYRDLDDEHPDERMCALDGCMRTLKGKAAQAKYCSLTHRQKAADARFRLKKSGGVKLASQGVEPSVNERRGEVFDRLMESGDGQRILDKVVSAKAIAELYGVTPASISRGLEAYTYQKAVDEAQQGWQMGRLTKAMFPKPTYDRLKELGYEANGTREFEELLDQLVRSYSTYSRRYFALDGKRVLLKDFHLEWIRIIIKSFAIGSKELILSPPRHGKSEMLIRFVIWMIIMDHEMRIIWVAANSDVAKMMLGSVKDHFESNVELIAATLPPGETYKPKWGENKKWSSTEIKIRQQKTVGQKSSSMLALGRTSKILSRDVGNGGLIIDDMEDLDTVREARQRQYSREKLAEIGTRKEETTAQIYIGSRQHPDDIPTT